MARFERLVARALLCLAVLGVIVMSLAPMLYPASEPEDAAPVDVLSGVGGAPVRPIAVSSP